MRFCCVFYFSFYCCIMQTSGNVLAQNSSTFPVVDAATQKNRDDIRKQILLDELKAEKYLFKEAQNQLTKQKNTNLPQSKVSELQENLQRHQSNIDALNKEIANISKTSVSGYAAKPMVAVNRATKVTTESKTLSPNTWDIFNDFSKRNSE